uniref:Uncharacterized protein n=1 Tax=Glossina palpalis gambiensis TaxID=67801 RepID=A0A1B0AS74_9MUSC
MKQFVSTLVRNLKMVMQTFSSIAVIELATSNMGYWVDLRDWLCKDPAKLVRHLVLFICCIIVVVQLTECFEKLKHPPISTHSYYILNETIQMPAITICREPAYKEEVLTNISGRYCSHPKYDTCWFHYPFGVVDLEEFFINSTFNQNETFLPFQYGLNGLSENVEITSSLHFYNGRCFTMRPRILLQRATKNSGYSMILTHHIQSDHQYFYYETEPGWHLFIHDSRENFTEISMKASGRVEYVFIRRNEEIEIKLQTKCFVKVEGNENLCSTLNDYSDLKSGEICIWEDLASKANCTGPWMYDIPHQPPCSSCSSMTHLIREYKGAYDSEEKNACNCIPPCESHLFSAYIQSRRNFHQPEPNTQIWIYYTTKLISMVEERPNYDTIQFIADVGGSLGFLLGLSVLGLIGILQHLTLVMCGGVNGSGLVKRVKHINENRFSSDFETDKTSRKSDETVDIAIVYP